ncbi:MAG: hypothetical protein ABJI69_06255 [Balneola sp.]
MVNISVDGKNINTNIFVIPPMGLSSSKSHMNQHAFTCEIPKSIIIELMSSEYKQWVSESKDDDDRYDEPQDELGLAGYPDIDLVLENKALTKLTFGDYLVRELLEKLIENNKPNQFKFWFDEITDCSINQDLVIFEGVCYSK